ncbi:EamA family transporter [Microbacterium esteraromaticum]|uniref:EamA family transporter n=1 Tax=Microbacterium esteraromaticum TaxID=57043 RepID=A0A7D8AHY8_9MICO|nr:EamA family transporter [Microbacterium esteraromaticum]QMU98063.1 EamA family transporter [Microbacterium esteraromaticum]
MIPLRVLLLTALAPMAWGTTYLVTTELLPAGHPLLAGLLRALPAGVLALVAGRALPRGSWWWKASVLGILNISAFFPLLFIAAERLPGGAAAAIAGVQPLIIIGLGRMALRERTRVLATIAALVGAGGVTLVVLGPSARLDPVGVLAALGGVAATASGVVLTKRWGRPAGVGPVAYAGWQLSAGGLMLLPLTLLLEPLPTRVEPGAILGYLWLASVGGLLAYVLWFRGIQQLPVAAPGLLALLSPVVATVLGVLVAGETFTTTQSIGIATVLVALVAGQMFTHRRAEPARLDPPPARSRELSHTG